MIFLFKYPNLKCSDVEIVQINYTFKSNIQQLKMVRSAGRLKIKMKNLKKCKILHKNQKKYKKNAVKLSPPPIN